MIKVFKASDLIKYSLKIVSLLVIMFFLIQLFMSKGKEEADTKGAMLFCIDEVLPEIKIGKIESYESISFAEGLKYAFTSELEVIDSIKQEEENTQVPVTSNEVSVAGNIVPPENNNEIQEEATVTEVINSGVNPRYTTEYQGVFINNSTKYNLTQILLI